MKKKSSFIFLCLILTILPNIFCQNFNEAYDYLKYIKVRDQNIIAQMWDYTRTEAHSQKNKKINKSKEQLIKTIEKSKQEISAMPAFKGKADLRDSMIIFFKLYEKILSGDYAEIEALEFSSKKSYQAMKKYLDKIDKTNKKLLTARKNVASIFNRYAEENNIKLQENRSELMAKMKLSNIVNDYYNKIFLIYFQVSIAQSFVIKAINNADSVQFHSWSDSLRISDTKAINHLSAINSFNGDVSLKYACSNILQDQKIVCSQYIPTIQNFYTAKSKFIKIKKFIDKKNRNDLTKENIDEYNKAVKNYNISIEKYNQSIKKIIAIQNKDSQLWDISANKFLDKHIPKK